MLRLLLVFLLVCLHARSTATEPAANPLMAYRSPLLSEALRLGDSVRTRFALAAEAASCDHSESLYGYNLLVAMFGERGRAVLESAAADGTREGGLRASAWDPAACETLLRTLHSADNELVVLAEQAASRTSLSAAVP